MMAAIRHLEQAVTSAERMEGVVLRYGGFYGPGTTLSADPEAAHSVAFRKRQFPVVGDGGGVWSFIHVDDAAAATVLAVEAGGRGIYNVVDDEPAPTRVWMPDWPACSVPSRPGTCRAGSAASWRARRRP